MTSHRTCSLKGRVLQTQQYTAAMLEQCMLDQWDACPCMPCISSPQDLRGSIDTCSESYAITALSSVYVESPSVHVGSLCLVVPSWS